ncbi:MAG: hypothetical protein SVR81_10660 [Chloroflexota bacterium]|nr:hypothetical protein [Chloroflexota bacterium]
MKNTNNLKNRIGSALRHFYFNTLWPILDGAASSLSPWDEEMLVPTSVQSTSYYLRHKDQSRF